MHRYLLDKQAIGSGFSPVKIFSAIPSPFFSAAVELRTLTPIRYHTALFQ